MLPFMSSLIEYRGELARSAGEGITFDCDRDCPRCGSDDVTVKGVRWPYRGCFACGLMWGEMTPATRRALSSHFTDFDVTLVPLQSSWR